LVKVNNAASTASFLERKSSRLANRRYAKVVLGNQCRGTAATLCCDEAAFRDERTAPECNAAPRNCDAVRRPALPFIVMFSLENPT
jgi:hypothetical protein